MVKKIIQSHHLIYGSPEHPEQEEVVKVRKGEHRIATLMNAYCRKTVSKGFIKWLKFFICLREDRAIDLEEKNETKI